MHFSLQAFLFIILYSILLNIVVVLGTKNEEPCGLLAINPRDNSSYLAILEGVKIPHLKFLNITEKLVGASLFVKSGCRVDICGVAASTGTADDLGGCNSFWKYVAKLPDVPYNKLYSMTSLSCACSKNRIGCESSTCVDDFLQADDCALLYQEINCQSCYYNPVRLKSGDVFKTDSSASIKSRIVRQGCHITMKTKGALWADRSYDFVYTSNANYMDPMYHIELGGEEFVCRCPSRAISSTTALPILSTDTTKFAQTNLGNFSETPDIIISGISISESTDREPENLTNGADAWYSIVGVIVVIVLLLVLVVVFLIHRRHKGLVKAAKNPAVICDDMIDPNSPVINEEATGPNPQSLSEEKIEGFKSANAQNDVDSTRPRPINWIEMSILSEDHSRALDLPYDSKFEIPRNRFIIDVRHVLGQGNYGIVYKGRLCRKVDEDESKFEYIDVAIKTLRAFATSEYVKPLQNEIKVISYMGHHPNIVCFLGACTVNQKNGDIYILMEYCHKGNLKSYLESIKPPPHIAVSQRGYAILDLNLHQNDGTNNQMNEELFRQLLHWSQQIAAGMHYLCLKNVIHIDLATRNIFLTNELVAKIGDFGLSRKLYSQPDYNKTGSDAVPVSWIALESMRDAKYSPKSDVWAYGVVLFEIFSFGDEPYGEKTPREIFAMLNSGKRLSCPQYATQDIYAQMMRCWDEDPESRPTFQDLEKFFRDLNSSENDVGYFE